MKPKFSSEKFILADGREIILRPCTLDDVTQYPDFQKQIAQETNFTLQTLQNTPSLERSIEKWEPILKNSRSIKIGAFDQNRLIGELTVRPIVPEHPWNNHVGQFGMMILKDYWANGIGRRMLEILEDHARQNGFLRIEAMVRVRNLHGIKLYVNSGFSIEGTRKQAAYIDGAYWDEYYIAKLLNSNKVRKSVYPQIETERVIVRHATLKDIPAILSYLKENRSSFSSTDPSRPVDYYSESFWIEQLSKAYEELSLDKAYRFFLFEKENNKNVIGNANFTQVFRGPFQACYLGYALSKSSEGKGLMTEALDATIKYIFDEKKIHRIMANYLPENVRSARLLQRLGFVIEGQAKEYLHINGTWRDHVLTSLTNAKWNNSSN